MAIALALSGGRVLLDQRTLFGERGRGMKSSREVCQDLAKRLAGAAHSSAHNHPEEHCEERWSLVADTIEMMIDRAIHEHEQRTLGKESAL